MSDLAERLAAKLDEAGIPSSEWSIRNAGVWGASPGELARDAMATRATDLLPLLLSEPELVAGLAPEVKRDLLVMLLRDRKPEACCALCGHFEEWHTGSFDACNGPVSCFCDGFVAPSEAR